ncbi:hypothetical protein XIS1_590005 [Xenorhabdus innexi]|uniref:Uncharacterized protein n=1 Tax=Xenorhabdus innexi TaxID=290109 RepID=A0A1N6MZI9_9GAMM|nr:hypothetical protein XIS1_590005 [Xenorhabdus innexi]
MGKIHLFKLYSLNINMCISIFNIVELKGNKTIIIAKIFYRSKNFKD